MAFSGPCVTIQHGDTVSGIADRLTGRADAQHHPWFQVVDPQTNTVVPKSQYDAVQPGWQACVMRVQANTLAGAPGPQTASVAFPFGPSYFVPRAIPDPGVAFMLVALLISAALLWQAVDRYLTEREKAIDAMRQFGERFVREFERPLLDAEADARPLRSRLKVNPDRRRLEILLAPTVGRRYPNLSDHRDNLAYDIGRVVRVLRDQSFVGAPPRADGAWVVLPFHYHVQDRQVAREDSSPEHWRGRGQHPPFRQDAVRS